MKAHAEQHLKLYWFQPGQSGNPGGRRKIDLAAEIARALFEQDGQAIFEAFRKVLRKASPYAFQVLSDRAFGKLKETHAIEHSPYKHMSDEDTEKRIKELQEKLGLPRCEPKVFAGSRRPNQAQLAKAAGLYIRCTTVNACASIAFNPM